MHSRTKRWHNCMDDLLNYSRLSLFRLLLFVVVVVVFSFFFSFFIQLFYYIPHYCIININIVKLIARVLFFYDGETALVVSQEKKKKYDSSSETSVYFAKEL